MKGSTSEANDLILDDVPVIALANDESVVIGAVNDEIMS